MSVKDFIQKFLEKEPPYKTVVISSEQILELGNVKILTINHHCTHCNTQRTFKSLENPFNLIKENYGTYCLAHFNDRSNTEENFFKHYSACFLLDFSCQHDCDERHYFTLLISKGTIQKIGQYPTFAKEEVDNKIIKYKPLIPKYYPELTRAVNAYSQNMGVASFVYLRRILEHLIEEKYKRFVGTIEVEKFTDKLKEVEKHENVIPDYLDEIKNQIYSVLSKGVHEYEESECLTLFPVVGYIIESILDEELSKREKAKKAQEAKKIIQEKLKEKDSDKGQS